MDEFLERSLSALTTLSPRDRGAFFSSLLYYLSVSARGSGYVAAGFDEADSSRRLSAFNEMLHQVGNKMENDLVGANRHFGEYGDADWLRNMRSCAHYLDTELEGELAWMLGEALARVVPTWKEPSS